MVHSVRDVMTRDVVTVTPSTPFKQIVRLLHDQRIGAVPWSTPTAACSASCPRPTWR